MLNAISHSQVFVLDQDEALDFYVNKLGLEVAIDADMGHMRFLTVRVPGDHDHELVLEQPGTWRLDESTVEEVRELVTKGAAGGWIILRTDDCRATYAELRDRGVEFFQEPEERFYGVDCALRDPFGNPVRITQPAPKPLEVPETSSS